MAYSQVIVWLVVGAIAGYLAGRVIKGRKEGFGRLANLGIGLVGALIGGALFDVLGIDFGLGELSISLRDLLSAFIGALIFLAGIWWIRRKKAKDK